MGVDEALERLGVDAAFGLSTGTMHERLVTFGPNWFTAARTESRLHAFLRRYADPVQLVPPTPADLTYGTCRAGSGPSATAAVSDATA